MHDARCQVQQLVFELEAGSRSKAMSLHDIISKLFYKEIQQQIEAVIEENDLSHRLVRIDSLTLDLGSIADEDLELQLPAKIREALLDYFSRFFTVQPGEGTRPAVPAVALRHLELFSFFLLHGWLPWWAGHTSLFVLEQEVLQLADTHAAQLRQLLLKQGRNVAARRRMVFQFSDLLICRLVTVLEPDEAIFLFDYHASVIRLQQQENLVKIAQADFRQEVWGLVLDFLLDQRGSYFNRKTFVRSMLAAMAAHYNLAYAALLSLLYRTILRTAVFSRQAALVQTIQAIAVEAMLPLEAEAVLSDATDPLSTPTREGQQLPVLDMQAILAYFLRTGTLPWWVRVRVKAVSDLLVQLAKQSPAAALQLLQQAAGNAQQRSRMLYQFSPALLGQVLDNLPGNTGEVMALRQELLNEQVLAAASGRPLAPPAEEELLPVLDTRATLAYFFRTGMLPWWMHVTLENVGSLLIQLVKEAPAAALPLLQQAAGNAQQRSRMLYHFSPALLGQVLDNLPGDTGEVSVLRQLLLNEEVPAVAGQPLAPPAEEELLPALDTRAVLTYFLRTGTLPWWMHVTLEDVGSLLTQLVKESPRQALQLLQQAAGDAQQRSRMLYQFSPALLGQVLDNLPGNTGEVSVLRQLLLNEEVPAVAGQPLAPPAEEELLPALDTRAVLTYFLRTGTLPWWMHVTLENVGSLLTQLVKESPRQALQLLQQAAGDAQQRSRMLYQFSPALLRQVLRLLPGGDAAVGAAGFLLSVFHSRLPGTDADMLDVQLAGLLWNHYHQHHYLTFEEPLFYLEYVRQLLHRYPRRPVQWWASQLAGFPEPANWRTSLEKLALALDASDTVNDLPALPDQVANKLLLQLASAPGFLRQFAGRQYDALDLPLYLLQYFFRHQRLPPPLQQLAAPQAAQLVKTALLQLHRQNPVVFKALLQEYDRQPGLPDLLQSLLSLQSPEERAILLLQGQVPGSNTGERGEGTFPLLVPLLPAGSALFKLWAGSDTPPGTLPVLAAAENTLVYFLQYHRFPPVFEYLDIQGVDALLKQLVLLLLDADRDRLQQVLARHTLTSLPGMRVYGLFHKAAGGAEARAAAVLQTHYRQQVWAYLLAQPEQPTSMFAALPGLPASLVAAPPELLRLFKEEAALPSQAALLQRALYLLGYFLLYNRLPDGLALSTAGTDVFVSSLFRWVGQHDEEGLRRLLQQHTHHAAARMRLHEWFNESNRPEDQVLQQLTQIFLQQDMLAYLRWQQQDQQETSASVKQLLFRQLTDTAETGTFLRSVTQHLPFIRYLARHYPGQLIQRWLLQAALPWWPYNQVAFEWLDELLERWTTGSWAGILLKEFLLLAQSGRIAVAAQEQAIPLFFDYVEQRAAASAALLYHHLRQALDNPYPGNLPAAVQRVKPFVTNRTGSQNVLLPPPAGPTGLQPAAVLPATVRPVPPAPPLTANTALPQNKEEKIYIRNAGLVLLHPFLPIFFGRLQLIEKGRFTGEAAQHRAIHLLQYLADGLVVHEEHMLVLNKLLCGLPLEEPLPASIHLLPEEEALTQELFTVLFRQWEKMKNATVEGFRQSFLQREGFLSRQPEHWTLRVEQRGYDLLLQTLPWAYGNIRLSWMQVPIQVEWA